MKKIIFLLILSSGFKGYSQNAIPIPDTLSGPVYNLNIHPDSVQFLPGTKTFTNAFNQYSYLGPTLILHKGENVTMNVLNSLDDTTTVHWHGLHVPAMADGGPHTFFLSGSTWSPQFTVNNHASTFWYHPHTHMKTGQQAMRGAAGMIIVRDSIEANLNLPRQYGIDDFPIVVQSQQMDANNQILWRGMHDSLLLVNGTQNPMLSIPAQVVRLRLLNASQERNFNFGFTGNRTFKVIGNDGGLLNAPVDVTRIRLSPGERAEVLLDLTGMTGQQFYLMSYASEFGAGIQGGTPMPGMDTSMYSPINGIDFNILQLNVSTQTNNPVTTIPASLVSIIPWDQSNFNEFRNIIISAQSMMSMDGPFYFNGQLFDMNRIDYRIPLNNVEIWSLSNQSMVAHLSIFMAFSFLFWTGME
ncbi:MAG: multicopper oxidase domain-containing protein [Bacteroidetes bacterium]|nr:multicopper oxidase domain-containing protein [Bacteroidota bacterium]